MPWRTWFRKTPKGPPRFTRRELYEGFIGLPGWLRVYKRHLQRSELPYLWRWMILPVAERLMGRFLVVKAFKPLTAAAVVRLAARRVGRGFARPTIRQLPHRAGLAKPRPTPQISRKTDYRAGRISSHFVFHVFPRWHLPDACRPRRPRTPFFPRLCSPVASFKPNAVTSVTSGFGTRCAANAPRHVQCFAIVSGNALGLSRQSACGLCPYCPSKSSATKSPFGSSSPGD